VEPYLDIAVASGFDNYRWEFEDGSIISTTYTAQLEQAGDYILTIGQTVNDLYCENTYAFSMARSVLPEITEVRFQELSDANYIEIIAAGDGAFEYSLDGKTYQKSNLFSPVEGGVYTVYVRDIYGCGIDSKEITLLDYPKFFTPNGDGYHDLWQIAGITRYPDAKIHIYDRYGKLLKQLSPLSPGWDGTYRGVLLPATDYWFNADLGDGPTFKGHFALKR
tara:strand:- start:8574 stop:9236 length:663 start_codon:yes stop_codon:yes gene_type:complete